MTESSAADASLDDGFDTEFARLRRRAERVLDAALSAQRAAPARLRDAMRYACLGGGKRVRAMLVYAAGRAFGVDEERLDAPACAVEMIHAYSLVHDDLPCMDDDDLRRGKPTCHRAYDEATALLVGDALQSEAFDRVARAPGLDAATRVEMVATLARASGADGMAGGQAVDLFAVGTRLELDSLETMHRLKTGALIRASARLGALTGVTFERDEIDGISERDRLRLERIDRYAAALGLAFQIRDDVLDVEESTETLGKTQGADAALDKPTYPALLGLDASKARAARLHDEALAALADFEDASLLHGLAAFIVRRRS